MTRLLVAVVLLAATGGAAAGQRVTLDEGSFTISRDGKVIGREGFTIRSTPGIGGPIIQARATVTYDGSRRLAPVLQADSTGAATQYQLEVRAGPDSTTELLTGMIQRGRFSATTRTPRGEDMNQYVVAEGALILDDDVFHQYYFVARSNRTGAIPVVVPHRNVQVTMRVEDRGASSATVGGERLPARLLVLVEPDGADRQIWVDSRGRVLRVELRSRGIVAVRDDPP
jgi:hypothetical protein